MEGGRQAGACMGGQGGAQGREESSGRKVPWTLSTNQLAGGLRVSPALADTQPRGRSLSVSNYDKWQWVDVAGWQLPHRGGTGIFSTVPWGPGSEFINHGEQH